MFGGSGVLPFLAFWHLLFSPKLGYGRSLVRLFVRLMKYLCCNFIYNFFGYLLLAIYAFVMHFSFLVFGQFLHTDLLVLVCALVGVCGALCACVLSILKWAHTRTPTVVCDVYSKPNKLRKKFLAMLLEIRENFIFLLIAATVAISGCIWEQITAVMFL